MICNKTEDQLINYLLNTLKQAEAAEIEKHLSSCQKCQRRYETLEKTRSMLRAWKPVNPPPDLKQKVMDDIQAQKLIEEKNSKGSSFITAEREKTETQTAKPKTTPMVLLKTVINYKITAFASAVLLIMGIVLGVNFINQLSAPDVVWGELVEKIEGIDFYTFKSQSISMDIQGTFVNQQTNKYYISKDGFRIDRHYPWIFYDIMDYASWLDKTYITVFPEIKKYTRILLTDERINRMGFLDDPRLFIKLLMSFNYTNLGNKIIDGKEAEGIEISNPKFGKMGFESCIVGIWVDIDTNLPILLDIETISGHGRVESKIVFNTFEWNREYDSSLFEPNLSGYSLMAEVESMPINQESTIEALKTFSQVADGKYPSSLEHTQTLIEVNNLYYKIYKEKMGKGFLFWEAEDFDWEGNTSLHSHLMTASMFYGELFNNDKEVAYYGEKVTANDVDLPLMRWKIADDEYKVIFADLSIEEVSEEELAGLEEALNN